MSVFETRLESSDFCPGTHNRSPRLLRHRTYQRIFEHDFKPQFALCELVIAKGSVPIIAKLLLPVWW